MTIQNILFPNEPCTVSELYFRSDVPYRFCGKYIEIEAGNVLTTDTYMNVLDVENWRKYTTVKDIWLELEIQGDCIVSILREVQGGQEEIVYEEECRCIRKEQLSIKISREIDTGLCYWKIRALKPVTFYKARYVASHNEPFRKVQLAVNICTYHREQQLLENLRVFQESLFFQTNSKLYGKLEIVVTDNGRSFRYEADNEYITVCENDNEGGGSGGFARGLTEIKRKNETFHPTHIVFMDDDVQFQMESFYRLFTFLSLVKREYQDRPVAGRMFRLDSRYIQYTAAEHWNRGNIVHINENLDMTKRSNIWKQEEEGEYGGWWFCTYPAEYALENQPFPFFIHCDDVEYGLRYQKPAIVVKGVQVWHETFEHRITPEIVYYDTRNALAVNAMQGYMRDREQFIGDWKKKLSDYHNTGNQALKYMCILGMDHFIRKKTFYKAKGKIPEFHVKMKERIEILRYFTPLYHRYIECKLRKQYNKIQKSYEEREGN